MPDPVSRSRSRPRTKAGSRGPAARGAAAAPSGTTAAPASWTFLTNHAHVLLCLMDDRDARLRDVATLVGITERAVLNIVRDLEEAGIVERRRDGRRNQYRVHGDHPLRHPLEAHCHVGEMLGSIRDARAGR